MAQQSRTDHPLLDLYMASLTPWMRRGPSHENDPPPLRALPQLTLPELQELLDLLVAADRDLRTDHFVAAARTLDVAEMRIRVAAQHGTANRAVLDAVLEDIALAREAAERRDSAHACGAVISAVRALLPQPPPPPPR